MPADGPDGLGGLGGTPPGGVPVSAFGRLAAGARAGRDAATADPAEGLPPLAVPHARDGADPVPGGPPSAAPQPGPAAPGTGPGAPAGPLPVPEPRSEVLPDPLPVPPPEEPHLPPLADGEHPTASYRLHVNGEERDVHEGWIGESLLFVLRERLGLAGAKDGCEQGECGACSVQLDGRLVASCLVPAALAEGQEIRTVEGLAPSGVASDVQQALAEHGAVQCGYCVPGMAMAVSDLLDRNPKPSDAEAREGLSGNLCRCSGYCGALAAVRTLTARRAAQAEADADAAEAEAAGQPAPDAARRGGHAENGEHP